MTRIGKLFEALKEQNRCGIIAYLTAGDPSPEATPGLVAALERGGADLIELGVPFSDPIADGPVIQQAGDRAIAAGTTLAKVLSIAAEIRKQSEIPLLLFTYLNPALRYGFQRLAADAKAAGIDGCLLTDVSVEEAREYVKVMRAAELDTVFLAAPTSTEERLKLVAEYSSGFVYLVSRTGITGRADADIGRGSAADRADARPHQTAACHGIRRLQTGACSRPRRALRGCGDRQRDRASDRARCFEARVVHEGTGMPGQHLEALARCRVQIDELDRRLVDLLNERTSVVEEIGRLKKEAELAIYEPSREVQVFENITAHNRGPLSGDGLKRIFERIIDEMRRVQKDRMQGTEG